MIMTRHATRWGRWIAAVLPLVLSGMPASGDAYDTLPPYGYPSEAASQWGPYDPVPEIDPSWCRWRSCAPRRPIRHVGPPPGPMLPGLNGHMTLLVDCGLPRGGRGPHHRGPHGPVFASVSDAADVAPPNSTILIIPPGQGMTCVESVRVHGPLTIATYGGSGKAVIQAPAGQPCLTARIPLGDTLVLDGVRFISRSKETPCVAVEAGRVVMRNSSVDSRGTDWGFDVHESGELLLESSKIETDASAVHARRATVTLKNVEIDIDGRNMAAQLNLGRTDCIDRDGGTIRGSVGLALECSEGTVEGGSIIGGGIGILASAGTRGLRITDVKVTKADTGVLILPGQRGAVIVERATIAKSRDGIVVAPGAESQITGSVITDSSNTGITAFGAGTLIASNKVINAGDGIRILASQSFPPPIFPDFSAIAVIDGDDGGPIVENNLVANVRHAAVRIDARGPSGRQHRLDGKLIGNTLYAMSPAVCIDDDYNDDPVRVRANVCNRERFFWPF
jgi:hypothetical protein